MSEIWRIDNLQKTVTTVTRGGSFTTGNNEHSSSISVTFEEPYYWLSYGNIGKVARMKSDSTYIDWVDSSYEILFFDELIGNSPIWAWLRTNATQISDATPYVLRGQKWRIKDSAPIDKGSVFKYNTLFVNGGGTSCIVSIEGSPTSDGNKDWLIYKYSNRIRETTPIVVASADYTSSNPTYQFGSLSDKTLNFLYAPTGELLEWLKKNADLVDTGVEAKYQDLHISDVDLNTQFKQDMSVGRYQQALDVIANKQLDSKTMIANTINYTTKQITAVQNIGDVGFKKDKIQVTNSVSTLQDNWVYFDTGPSKYVEIWTIRDDIPISSSAADISKLNLNTSSTSARAFYNSSDDPLWLDIVAIWCSADTTSISLRYMLNDAGTFTVAHWDSTTGGHLQWGDDGTARTILFNKSPTGDLLTWLQNNAIRRVL